MSKQLSFFALCVLGSNPIFAQTPNPPQRVRRSEIVFIDPGHGGKDQGTASKEFHYEEKTLTLSLALAVQSYLKRMGYKPQLTRSSDVYVDLGKRVALANRGQADVFVSIHCNYSSNTTAFGTEVYFYNGKNGSMSRNRMSEGLGQNILNAMGKNGILKSRGLKTANFVVIRDTSMPAVLVETGFLSNPRERAALQDTRYRMHIAKGIAEGVHNFLSGSSCQKPKQSTVKIRKLQIQAS
ncbi:N-acetylmuramoyl-L-alanine amidase AmiC precursor,N-acetylmuramoyl-l-alanine amidase I,N-acetylmuramoyl-L-alanine amidase CwlD,N-acetylmuramoyl-L-alanine amidase [Chlamydia serpentis]|uniref:N-acetylmuramoyl-L-alanine amidase n=2 Tax=Chlamydia serpentis TaxID=1967782 RepID=A0A2R8FB24_9CHLA|nr:N-acetylmuramoyl-L-alanine amidase [Chlamydia serpentis]SPN73551.1 N-acetylmuramoyl-L-alanine amidase AmiC precursor,N-acetylmuramoyl-l-alanine amidase I,N-acetylmuramoyl-L-alanine amidase CwlD,N-acetylmuramoyl-L-alanine amidase [Chlamydia serpentis]